ncbi:MAG: amidohydrolase, partial [Firmicutes bacterium]|nr:amidohydrolase [Bacillota bacterium]
MDNIRERAAAYQADMVEFRRDLHRHPELSLQEKRTTDRIAEELDKLGIAYKRFEPTGLMADIVGGVPAKKADGTVPCVALRADIDALPMTEQSGVEFASETPGVMHSCGHDTHAAMLLGAVKVINDIKDQMAGKVRFIFQPAEENAEGARLAIAQGCLEGVDRIYGIHIAGGEPAGKVIPQKGTTAAAADMFRVVIKGKAAHGAAPQFGVDATVCAAAVILELQTLVSRELSPFDAVVVTVGQVHSGTRFNIISGEAVLEGTCRTLSRAVKNKLPDLFRRKVEGIASAYGCEVEIDYKSITDTLVNDPEGMEIAAAAGRKITGSDDIVPQVVLSMGSEDFSEYTAVIPGAFSKLGGGGEYAVHSDKFVVD